MWQIHVSPVLNKLSKNVCYYFSYYYNLVSTSYRKLLKSFTRLRHLLLNKPRVTEADKEKLAEKEAKLQRIRVQGSRVREVTAEVSSEHMLATGVGVDICQVGIMTFYPVYTHVL